MKKSCAAGCAVGTVLFLAAPHADAADRALSLEALKDKIKGGWAGQTIGCTFGGPTEFRWRGTFIQDYQPVAWNREALGWYYANAPGLYDDVYMDLTFVEVFEKEGADAPAASFAQAFAHAEYSLWHANQAARYNILRGLAPPASGHWLDNPHADDIDFQIESDFAGLMCPGLPNAAAAVCDKIGHIMNYGDGWYGGVFVALMYSLAFIRDNPEAIAREALLVIPEASPFHRTMADVLRWHNQYPNDWKQAWFEVQRKWSGDVGCPEGVFNTFNIDTTANAAWVLIGLLYGEKDFGRTVSIATRCGDDSDCNPSTAGGILGTMLGYSRIPAYWKQGLAEVEPMDFKYTTTSLNDVYGMGFKHALETVRRNGGRVDGQTVFIPEQKVQPVPLEIGFEGHFPAARKSLNLRFGDAASFEFEGIGFVVSGNAVKKGKDDVVLKADLLIDGKSVEVSELPTRSTIRKATPFWRYRLQEGKHAVTVRILNPTDKAEIMLGDLVVYGSKPAAVTH